MKKGLLCLSLIEGATVMATELCGAKLLAPVFGTSLFVWSSVMGITLAALALGYFIGGALSADTAKAQKRLCYCLIAASFFTLLMPIISQTLVPYLSYFSFIPGMLLSTFCVLFIPVLLLGTTSPFFILLQVNDSNTAGKASGFVYAMSTLGGIFSTFLCGFFLIPELGLRVTVVLFGLILFIATVIYFKFYKIKPFIMLSLLFLLNLGYFARQSTYLFFSESIMGRLEVKEEVLGTEITRMLLINGVSQSLMNTQTHKSSAEYLQLLDSLVPTRSNQSAKALILGLGGGMAANNLVKKNYQTEAVEFDPRIVEVSKRFFFLSPKVKTYQQDARYFLNHCTKKYDVLFVDLFRSEELPAHVLSLESLIQLKRNFSDSSILYINWHGFTSNKRAEGSRILFNTLTIAGYHVKMCSTSSDEEHRNVIFVVSLVTLPPLKGELPEKMAQDSKINTDNQPCLDKYNAAAHQNWRMAFLNYNQKNRF